MLVATVVREVSHPHVVAMFRLAIAEAEHSPEVAQTLNERRSVNRGAIAELLGMAQAAGILGDGDQEQVMERFFALLWGDLMLSRLLGAAKAPKPADIEKRARTAAEGLLKLHPNPADGPKDGVS